MIPTKITIDGLLDDFRSLRDEPWYTPAGQVRTVYHECPICALVRRQMHMPILVGDVDATGALRRWLGRDLSVDELDATGEIMTAADVYNHPLRPALLKSLGHPDYQNDDN